MTHRIAVALLAAAAIALAASATASAARTFTAHRVPFGGSHLYARDYPGTGPAIVLMHGFPDNLHLYDRLLPHLEGRHVVTFDFLGWGRSGKPRGHTYTFSEQADELDAVVRALGLDRVVPVAHDASGPAAINWSLAHQANVSALVLLNTFYGVTPTILAPEAIRIFSDPTFSDLAAAFTTHPAAGRFLFFWQVGTFISDRRIRDRLVAKLWRQFFPAVIPAFAGLNRDLTPALAANTARSDELSTFTRPVRIVFGDRDRYLNSGVARTLHEQFPTSDLFLLPARHYVQVDKPAQVAKLIRSVPPAP
jgi:haloalkane dehalogenase